MKSLSNWLAKLGKQLRMAQTSLEPNPDATHPWSLSRRAISWNDHDCLLLRDLYTASHIWGATGSGKSSGPFSTLTHSCLTLGAGALFLTVKGTDAREYVQWVRSAGREQDLILIGPDHPETCFNFLAELGRGQAGLVANITGLLSTLSTMVTGHADGHGGESGKFWAVQDDQLIARSATALVLAGEELTTRNLEKLILSIPNNREEVADAVWRSTSYLWRCLEAALTRGDDKETFERLAEYYLVTLAKMSEKTRSTIVSSVLGTLNIFEQPAVRRMISSPNPSFDFSMLQSGKILVVDYPILVHEQQARLVQLVLKHCFMLCQNRRVVEPHTTRPVLLAADESQYLCNLEHDGKFLTTSRSSCTIVIYSTQSISNYLAMNSTSNAESQTHAMLANFQNQFFCQSTDIKTVEYAQSLLGKRKAYYMNSNTQRGGQDWVAHSFGLGKETGTNSGFSEQLAPLIEADDLHDLARGGPEHDFVVESLVYQSGKSFLTTGAPFMIARFRQQSATP